MGRVLVLRHPSVGSFLLPRIDGTVYTVMRVVACGHPICVVTTRQGRLVAVSDSSLDFTGREKTRILHGLIDKYESEQES